MISKIIIADDSKDFRIGLKELLDEIYNLELKKSANSYFIEEAENGLELLEKIKKNKPELIFMDIEMPYMNGFEATKKIVSLYPDIKIIGVSGNEKETYIEKLIDVGAKGYLTKAGSNFQVIKELITGKADSFVFSADINHNLPLLKSYKSILFVDKSENRHISLRHFLFKCGYTIFKARNATESCFYLKNKKIDAVIIDHSVIKRNKKFLSRVLDKTKGLKYIVLNKKIEDTEKINNNEIIHLKKDFSREIIVRIIENQITIKT